MTDHENKVLSEYAINMCSKGWLMSSASQLMSDGEIKDKLAQDISTNAHIYLIGRLPALSFSEEGFTYKHEKIKGCINYQIDNEKCSMPFEHYFPLMDSAIGVKLSEYR